MKLREARFPGTAPIDAYGNGGFRFADMSHKGSILCLPDGITAWHVASAEYLIPDDFSAVFEGEGAPELVLFGMGTGIGPVPETVRERFREHSIRLEVMGTGAAARTYNVLLAEGRSVGAALIAVD